LGGLVYKIDDCLDKVQIAYKLTSLPVDTRFVIRDDVVIIIWRHSMSRRKNSPRQLSAIDRITRFGTIGRFRLVGRSSVPTVKTSSVPSVKRATFRAPRTRKLSHGTRPLLTRQVELTQATLRFDKTLDPRTTRVREVHEEIRQRHRS